MATFEPITVAAVAIGCTLATAGDANHALITSEGANFRYRIDGTDPTASVGHLVLAGAVMHLEGKSEITNFRAIRDDSTDITLSVTYDKRSALARGG